MTTKLIFEETFTRLSGLGWFLSTPKNLLYDCSAAADVGLLDGQLVGGEIHQEWFIDSLQKNS